MNSWRLYVLAAASGLLLICNGCLTAHGGPPPPPRNTFHITILDEQTVRVQDTVVPVDQLADHLMATGADPRDAIVIKGAPTTPLRDIHRITQALNRANYRNTAFSSMPR